MPPAEHFTWIQCCPFYYTPRQPPLNQIIYNNPLFLKSFNQKQNQAYSYDLNALNLEQQPLLNDPGQRQRQIPQIPSHLTGTGRTDYFPESAGPAGEYYQPARLATSAPAQFYPTNNIHNNNFPFNSYLSPQQQENSFPGKSSLIYGGPNANYYASNITGSGQNFGNPILEGPPMNAIQHYANVAAYHQFIDTFNGLLSNYSKLQQEQIGKGGALQSTGLGAGSGGDVPVVGGYTPLLYQTVAAPDVPLQAAMENAGDGYVQPPLPSGLQNYMALTSPNPGATLSNAFSGSGSYIPQQQQAYYGSPTLQQHDYGYELTQTAPPPLPANINQYGPILGGGGGYPTSPGGNGFFSSPSTGNYDQYGAQLNANYGQLQQAQNNLNRQFQELLNLKNSLPIPSTNEPVSVALLVPGDKGTGPASSAGSTITVGNAGGGGVELKANGPVNVVVNSTSAI